MNDAVRSFAYGLMQALMADAQPVEQASAKSAKRHKRARKQVVVQLPLAGMPPATGGKMPPGPAPTVQDLERSFGSMMEAAGIPRAVLDEELAEAAAGVPKGFFRPADKYADE